MTNRIYTSSLAGIDSNYYGTEVQFIAHLTEMSYRLEQLAPNKLLPVAEQLHKNGIVSDSAFRQLNNDIDNQKIEYPFQLNDYCKYDRIFDPVNYDDDPAVWIKQVHHNIAAMMPGLKFTDFRYTTIPDTTFAMGGVPGVKFKISLTCNGHIYKHISSTFNYTGKQRKVLSAVLFGGGFYRIFNKILADQQSPYRLHEVISDYDGPTGSKFNKFGLIALRDNQADIFMKKPCLSYMSVSLENYDNTLTSGKIDSAIAAAKKIGLFAYLSEAAITQATDNAESSDLFTINKLLNNFPGVVYPLDSALIDPYVPDKDLLSHLAKITHGVFNPTQITQQDVKGGVKLQYSSNGKIHSYTFNTKNGWLNDKLPIFLKYLSDENNLPGRFYQLLYEDTVIYLTSQQHDYMVKHDLLSFEPISNKN